MTDSRRDGAEKGAAPAAPARLRKRAEFLHVAKGGRRHTPLFSLQANDRIDSAVAPGAPRFGLTVTKKTGCAVVRNRLRRRLRAAIADLSAPRGEPGADYVVVARAEMLRAPFETLKTELAAAIARVGRSPKGHSGRRRDARPSPMRDQAGS